MNKREFEAVLGDFVENSDFNKVSEEKALSQQLTGLKIYDDPLIGYASSDNEYLNKINKIPEAGLDEMKPAKFWLSDAKSVVSVFMPYTEEIRTSNIKEEKPSFKWLHGRIEGQSFINELLTYLKISLESEGYKTIVPSLDERFMKRDGRNTQEGEFGSNWSERHVAYAAGLGTFSLSKGLITEKGMAGRLGSLVTSADFEPSLVKYNDLYENCTMCGACIKRCPKKAISFEFGKVHKSCSDYLEDIFDEYHPYYGCGKCQVGVPCENRIPGKVRTE